MRIRITYEQSQAIFSQVKLGPRTVWDLNWDVKEWIAENKFDIDDFWWPYTQSSYPTHINVFVDSDALSMADAVKFKLRWL